MIRAFTIILSDDVEKTAGFYSELLGMERTSDFDWFIMLSHVGMPGLELGILKRDHSSVPAHISSRSGAAILTFVVHDLEETLRRAEKMKLEIMDGPRDMEYGQRRVMFCDPAGTAVDISSPIRSYEATRLDGTY